MAKFSHLQIRWTHKFTPVEDGPTTEVTREDAQGKTKDEREPGVIGPKLKVQVQTYIYCYFSTTKASFF
jgi:hypothetical protein